jgi:hypothetical protein
MGAIIMDSYQAYCENGKINPVGNPTIPEGRKIIITVLDEEAPESGSLRQLEALERFRAEIQVCDESLGSEFDGIISRRVNITRDIDL